jgi:hypothetical protein
MLGIPLGFEPPEGVRRRPTATTATTKNKKGNSNNMETPKTPKGLQPAGRRYYRQMVQEYVFDVEGLELLRQAAHEVDLIDRLQGQIDADETLVVRGSQGQPVSHPAVGEIRQHRQALIALTRALQLPSEDENAPGRVLTRSEQARRAAAVRWGARNSG